MKMCVDFPDNVNGTACPQIQFSPFAREIKGLPTLPYSRISLVGNTGFQQTAALPPTPAHYLLFPQPEILSPLLKESRPILHPLVAFLILPGRITFSLICAFIMHCTDFYYCVNHTTIIYAFVTPSLPGLQKGCLLADVLSCLLKALPWVVLHTHSFLRRR